MSQQPETTAKPTIEQCVKEILREQGQRDWVYPKQVAAKKLAQKTVDKRKAIMEQIIKYLRGYERLAAQNELEKAESQLFMFATPPEEVLDKALQNSGFEKVERKDVGAVWCNDFVEIDLV